jgi:putative ABC transport system permease protein
VTTAAYPQAASPRSGRRCQRFITGSAGLSGAQVLPALIGALLGIPGGFGLIEAVRRNAGSVITAPPAWWLAAVVAGTVVVVAVLTAVPARIGARRSVAVVLQTE